MDVNSMSVEFDLLYNNITSNLAPGLDDFEKSVFLTKALDEILKSYFNSYYNKTGEGFDTNERRLIDFSTLMEAAEKTALTDSTKLNNIVKLDERSVIVLLPTNILFITNESAIVINSSRLIGATLLLVIPLKYTEYTKLMSNNYKRPLKNLAWRLLNSGSISKTTSTSSNNYSTNSLFYAELILGVGDTLSKYRVRYVRRPKPIVLADLTDEGVTVDGVTTKTECELDPILHHEIVQRAVELAKLAYLNADSSTYLLLVGSSLSGTEKGTISRLLNLLQLS